MLNTSLVACGPVGEVCTDKALNEAYGKGSFVLDEAVRLSLRRSSGLK